MFTHKINRSRRSRILSNAVRGIYFYADGGEGAGGGAGDPPAAPPAKKKEKEAELEKLTLTKEELKAQIDAALKEEREARQAELDKISTEAKAVKDAADAEAARQKGEWEKVAKAEESKRVTADAEVQRLSLSNRRSEVKDQVRDYLAENHKAHIGSEKYILPLIEFDLKTVAEDIAKAVKKTADQYVKDNPRSAPAGGITGEPRSGVPRTTDVKRAEASEGPNGKRMTFTGAAARF